MWNNKINFITLNITIFLENQKIIEILQDLTLPKSTGTLTCKKLEYLIINNVA